VSACNWKEIQNLEVIAKVVVVYYVFIDQEQVFALHWFGLILFEEQ